MYKAYYEEPLKSEFKVKITDRITLNDKTYYLFDIAPFFPGGGGEEADFGYADGKEIEDCLESGENVYYSFSGDIGNIGDEVSCWVNIPLRTSRSVMHTSQHILSAIFADVYSLITDSVHFSDTYATIDLSGPEISDEEIRVVEQKANEIVRSCIEVSWQVVEPSELKNYRLRKVLGEVESPRVVSIPSVDVSLCCAVHVRNTGNIGLIKIIKTEHKSGVLKVTFTSGENAMNDYRSKHDAISKINAHLSSTTENVYERVLKKDDDISAIKKQMGKIRDELMRFEIERFSVSPIKVITKQGDVDELKKLGAALMENCEKAFIGIDKDQNKLIIYQNVDRPVNTAINMLKGLYEVKGGGNATSGQIMCVGDTLIDVANELIKYFDPANM